MSPAWPRGRSSPGASRALVAASALSALAVTAPLLRSGFVLNYDLAFVPRPRLSASLLGLGTDVPRAVPFGLLSALASRVVGGQVVEKALLVAVLFVAMWTAGRLVPSDRPAARIAAGLAYAWNPFVYERLLLGQAQFLLSYALLPAVAGAALRARGGDRRGRPILVLTLALAAFSGSYGGVFAVATAAAVTAFPPRSPGERPARAAAWAVAAGAVLNFPWLLPAMLRPGGLPSPALGFDLFRSRVDSPLGLVGSLLSLGGLWRTDLAPAGRATLAWVPAFVLMLALAAAGFLVLRERWPAGAVAGLAALAGVGFLLALGVSLPGIGPAVRWAGVHLPGGGILRDGQKFVAPLAVLLSVSFGLGVERALQALRAEPAARRVALAAVALPVALAPTLLWGAWGRLFTAQYPSSWGRAEAIMASDPEPGAVLVLPWHLYLPFRWNRDRPVIQPASVAFTRRAVVGDALEVGRVRLPGEDPWARLADPVVRGRGSLRPALSRLGIRYVLLFREADWRGIVPRLGGLAPVRVTRDLTLYRSSRPARVPSFPVPPALPVIAGDVLALGLAGWAAGSLVASRLDRGRAGMVLPPAGGGSTKA
jgi:hypothetical protein